MFNEEEFYLWEQKQMEDVHERWEPTKKRRAFDPCKERLHKRRRNLKWGGWGESYNNKWMWKRHIRNKYRLIDEDATHPPKKEYHTYGWLTW